MDLGVAPISSKGKLIAILYQTLAEALAAGPSGHHHGIANAQTQRRNNVTPLTIGEKNQRDVGAPIGIVLQSLHTPDDAVLVTLEIDDPVSLLVPAAAVPAGNAALVVPASRLLAELHQGLLWLRLRDLFER